MAPELVTQQDGNVYSLVGLIERASRDPSIDIEKMDRLLAMRERESIRLSQQCFNAALSNAQAEMLPIAVDSKNVQTQSKYASYAALDRVVRPIYTKHGFGLTFDTGEAPGELMVRVLCDVCHRDGYTKRYHIDMPVDGKGPKGGDVMSRTHATGSGVTYGKRYLLGMIFNLAIDKDDDGNAASCAATTVKTLPKSSARDIYTKLESEMDKLPTLKRLENWAHANETLFLALPRDWQDELTERYQERVAELSGHDVVWDEAGEHAADKRPQTVMPAPKRRLEIDHTDVDGFPRFLRR